MSEPGAVPLPREGQVFFDVRGESRSMRLSWYADSAVAVFSIWQGNRCTGTFRLPFDDLARMVQTLQSGPHGAGTSYGDPGDYQGGHYPPDYGYAAEDYPDAGYDSAGYDYDGYEGAGNEHGGYPVYEEPAANYEGAGYDSAGYDSAGYDSAGYDSAGYQGAGYQEPGYDSAGYDSAGYDSGRGAYPGQGPSGYENPRSFENPSSYTDLGYEHPGSYTSARDQRQDADWEAATASYPRP